MWEHWKFYVYLIHYWSRDSKQNAFFTTNYYAYMPLSFLNSTEAVFLHCWPRHPSCPANAILMILATRAAWVAIKKYSLKSTIHSAGLKILVSFVAVTTETSITSTAALPYTHTIACNHQGFACFLDDYEKSEGSAMAFSRDNLLWQQVKKAKKLGG